jgi:hypothetical protein
VRLREVVAADDYKIVGDEVTPHVGDLVVVETGVSELVGEVRRPRRPLPEFKRDRLYHRLLRLATDGEARAWRDLREREQRHAVTAQRLARDRALKI